MSRRTPAQLPFRHAVAPPPAGGAPPSDGRPGSRCRLRGRAGWRCGRGRGGLWAGQPATSAFIRSAMTSKPTAVEAASRALRARAQRSAQGDGQHGRRASRLGWLGFGGPHLQPTAGLDRIGGCVVSEPAGVRSCHGVPPQNRKGLTERLTRVAPRETTPKLQGPQNNAVRRIAVVARHDAAALQPKRHGPTTVGPTSAREHRSLSVMTGRRQVVCIPVKPCGIPSTPLAMAVPSHRSSIASPLREEGDHGPSSIPWPSSLTPRSSRLCRRRALHHQASGGMVSGSRQAVERKASSQPSPR